MSQITCCPACGTMFKVVADQLRISEGWVRCGHCAEIFDASAHMQDGAAAAMPSAVQAAAAAAEPLQQPAVDPTPAPHRDPGPQPASEPQPAPAPVAAVAEAEEYPPFGLLRPDAGDDSFPPAAPAVVVVGGGRAPDPRPAQQQEDDLHQVSFVRQARRKAFWRRPAVRALLAVSGLVLAALLAAQFAVQERDRLAAMHPPLRPWLERLCEPFACRVGPPRTIDAIVIDSSSFNKLRADLYRLSFTLKNQGEVAVAMPALELTLTDTQDQPVLRRVLAPPELGPAPAVIAGSAEWSGSLAVSVQANGSAARIAGYRLLAFYP